MPNCSHNTQTTDPNSKVFDRVTEDTTRPSQYIGLDAASALNASAHSRSTQVAPPPLLGRVVLARFRNAARITLKLFLKRMFGTRASSLAIFFHTVRVGVRKARLIGRGKSYANVYQDAYYAYATHTLGMHSLNYGARAPKPLPGRQPGFHLIAYYLPQYHPIPENDQWWGTGFTEWRNVTRAFPMFTGHAQPRFPGELGYYDLRIPQVMDRQIELAKSYGITAFCFHFYWFGGKRLLELPISLFVQNTDPNFKFCLCWANENSTRRWDGADHEILIAQSHSASDDLAFIQHLKQYFDDHRYLKIQGKPVLTTYRPGLLPDAKATLTRWRKAAERAGFPGLYLIATNSFGFSNYAEFGFDALSEFPPHGLDIESSGDINLLHQDFMGPYQTICDSTNTSLTFSKSRKNMVVFPGVMPSWDNTPRRLLRGTVFHGSTPALFYEWLAFSIDRAKNNEEHERFVFINAWNEWGEGAYLEPDREFGYAYLAACAAAVNDKIEADTRVAELFARHRDTFTISHRRAVALHLDYDDDLAGFFAHKITGFGDVDVYITVSCTLCWNSAKSISEHFKSSYILEVDNRGRDIRPFLMLYPTLANGNYEFICKLHSARSDYFREDGKWRDDIVDRLLSADAIAALERFKSSSSVGILAPYGTLRRVAEADTHIQSRLLQITKRLTCMMAHSDRFIAGSMFWFRPMALKGLHQLFTDGLEFEPELGQVDGTMTHAIERTFCIAERSVGMSTREFGKKPILHPLRRA